MKRLAAIGVVLAVALAGCGGDDSKTPAKTQGSPTAAPSPVVPAPGSGAQFPPAFLKCMSEHGVDTRDPSALHAPAAQAAFGECLPYLHGGGGP